METLWSPPPARIRVRGPRCPYCTDDIGQGEPQLACNRCRAWHHQACWTEGRGRCSACRSRETGRCRRAGEGRLVKDGDVHVLADPRLAALWGALAFLFFLGNVWILPPFRAEFAETGIALNSVTRGVLYTSLPWVIGLMVLFLVQLAACTGGQTRRQLVTGSLWLAGGFGIWTVWALLLPVSQMLRS